MPLQLRGERASVFEAVVFFTCGIVCLRQQAKDATALIEDADVVDDHCKSTRTKLAAELSLWNAYQAEQAK